jgi:hypothetical protein
MANNTIHPSSPSADSAVKTVRVRALTIFPKILKSNSTGGLPNRLEFETRVKPQSIRTSDYYLHLIPYVGPTPSWFGNSPEHEPVTIVLEFGVNKLPEALDRISPLIDPIIDDLEFQLQEPLKIYELEFLDATQPIAIGDRREAILFPFPGGYDQLKLQRSSALGAVGTIRKPLLRGSYPQLADKVQQAMDWYIKALHASYDVDRFIFMWISFEILRNLSNVKIEEPTKLRCGHTIKQCPECGKSTSVFRQAQTSMKYLVDLGVEQDVAKEIWSMRLIVHGAKRMTQSELSTLGRLLPELRTAVLSSLKVHFGIDQNRPPIVTVSAPQTKIALGISRLIDHNDLFIRLHG